MRRLIVLNSKEHKKQILTLFYNPDIKSDVNTVLNVLKENNWNTDKAKDTLNKMEKKEKNNKKK